MVRMTMNKMGAAVMLLLFTCWGAAAQNPNWQVDYSQFQFRMTVSAVVERGGCLLQAGENQVAVFVGDELRGVGSLDAYHEPTDRYLAIFQIGSNVASGETLEFRIYDEVADEVVIARYTTTFTSDGLLGSASNPLVLSDNRFPTDIALSATAYEENLEAGELIATVGTIDADDDTHDYSIANIQPAEASTLIQVVGNELQVADPANYEALQSFQFDLTATDPLGASVTQSVTMMIQDMPEVPTAISLSSLTVTENSEVPLLLGRFTVVDEDLNEQHRFKFSATATSDSSYFNLAGDSVMLILSPDYEQTGSLSLEVIGTDKDGLEFSESFAISVTDVNEAPVVADLNIEIEENVAVDEIMGTLVVTDPDIGQEVTLELLDTDLPFTLDSVSLKVAGLVNYEAQSLYTFRVVGRDNGNPMLTDTAQVQVTVLDVNEPPTAIELSEVFIAENSPVGTLVAEIIVRDEDQGETFTYEILADDDLDHSYFNLNDDQLITVQAIDMEVNESFSLDIRVRDGANHVYEQTVYVYVIDQNEPPVVRDTTFFVEENNQIGDLVGRVVANDPDVGQSLSYQLSSALPDLPMTMTPETGEVLATGILDFEQRSNYYLSVSVVDDGVPALTEVVSLHVVVSDVNEAPTDISITNTIILENRGAGSFIGTLSTQDPDQVDFFNYELLTVNGTTSNEFVILDNGEV